MVCKIVSRPALLAVALAVTMLGAIPAFAAMRNIPSKSADPYAGAIVMDADTGNVLFEDRADVPVYPASVVKLLDLLIIVERCKAGTLKLTDWVYATRESAVMGGTQVWLEEGEACTVDDLLYALIIRSANDAATALAIHTAGSKEGFTRLMNARAAEIGMTNSVFHSVHGLPPEPHQEPDLSTARDIGLLCRELVKHPEALRYTSTTERGFREEGKEGYVKMESHNPLLSDFPGCDGLKTGYFRKAGFSIAVTAKRDNRRVIAVVMGSESKHTRNARARELLNQGFLDLPPLPEAQPVRVQPDPESATQAPAPRKAGIGKKIRAFFIGLFRLLGLVLAAAVVVGVILGVRWLYIKQRDKWKYEL